MPHAAPFALDVEGAPQELDVISFEGREVVSRAFAFEVLAAGPSLEADALSQGYVGAKAHLQWAVETMTRWVHGRIARVRALGVVGEAPRRWGYRLRLVPSAWFLKHKKNSRIFQDKSVPEIVAELLGSLDVPFRSRLSSEYPRRRYCVQHQETDLDFVKRLLEEEGIFYYFEHPHQDRAREVMVFGDAMSSVDPVDGAPMFHIAPRVDGVVLGEADLADHHLERRARSARVRVKDFDYERPSFDVSAQAREAETEPVRGGLEQYHHHAELEPLAVTTAGARVRLEQHRRLAWQGYAKGRSTRVQVGRTLTIDGSEVGGVDASLLVVEVTHEAAANADRGRSTYQNAFRVLPGGVVPRPRPPRPRTQQVLETATVVGPKLDEIYTDELGRIKVQFHWDREGKRDEHSSCWIRPMQPWAGAGFGFQFLPRVGMEVVVAFLAGDADRPLVLGSVFNQEQLPPFPLPDSKTRSGIVTRTSPGGGGYNELSFQDLRGQEVITLRAERDFAAQVQKDHSTQIGGNEIVAVGADQTLTVGGESRTTVTKARFEQVLGARHVGVAGASTKSVTGNSLEKVAGHRTVDVTGESTARARKSATVRVDQKASLQVGDSLSVTVGSSPTAAGSLSTTGSWQVGADGEIVLRAEKGMRLECGDTVLTLLPDKLQVRAKTVDVQGADLVVLKGKDGVLELAGEAKLAAPKTRCFGSSSSLELTTDVLMQGARVRLGAREGDPPKVDAETEKGPTKPLSLKLSDGGYKPYANRPFELMVDGVRYTGTLDGSGGLTQDIPDSATQAVVTVWEGDPPTGASVRYAIAMGELEPATSLDGARARLRNLGYAPGAGEALDDETSVALREFQEDHDLEPTGELDGETSGKLQSVHGA